MLGRVALRILDRAKAALDDSVPAERIRAFLAEALTAAEAELSSRKVSLPPEAEGELRRARSLAARLGLLAAEPGPPSSHPAGEPRGPPARRPADAQRHPQAQRLGLPRSPANAGRAAPGPLSPLACRAGDGHLRGGPLMRLPRPAAAARRPPPPP